MKLHEHFLPDDLEKASREFHCIKYLLITINRQLGEGNIERAKHLSIDLTKSLHELSKLAEKKYQRDKMAEVAEIMCATGINIEVIRKLKHE